MLNNILTLLTSSQLLTGAAGKADEWRTMAVLLPVALYASWQVNGKIPDADAPRPKANAKKVVANEKRVAKLVNTRKTRHALRQGEEVDSDLEDEIDLSRMDRNYQHHYEAVLLWCVALRIWGSESISVEEANRAHDCHAQACQSWARMVCHLTPYFHLMCHMFLWILLLGPIYGWWAFPYERFNGFLSKVKHNGRPGELEATMMRCWTKLHLVYNLVRLIVLIRCRRSDCLLSFRSCTSSHSVLRKRTPILRPSSCSASVSRAARKQETSAAHCSPCLP